MIEENVPYETRCFVVSRIRQTTADIWKDRNAIWRCKAYGLKFWNGISSTLDSLGKVLGLWLLWLFLSSMIYIGLFKIDLKTVILATLHQGLGLGIDCDQLIDCYLFSDTHVAIFKLINAILAIVLLARIVDYFIQRFKEP